MRRLLALFEKGLLYLATTALLSMMILVSTDALGRHLFNSPLRGSFELTSEYLMVIVVFAALSSNYGQGIHVQLGVVSLRLEQRFPKNYRRIIALICLPIFSLLTVFSSIELIAKAQLPMARIGSVQVPIYLSYVWVVLGSFTLTLRFIVDIFSPSDNIVETVKNSGPPT